MGAVEKLLDAANSTDGPSMNDREMLEFLQEHGIVRLTREDWQPHQPLLYMFNQSFEIHHFGALIVRRRPNIARVDDPSEWRQSILVNDGQADYYAVDPDTKKVIFVKPGGRSNRPYAVTAKHVFACNDAVFPKQPRS